MDSSSRRLQRSGGKASTSAQHADGRGRHHANPYVHYFKEMCRDNGGNCFAMAKECGRRWKALPQEEKQNYKDRYQIMNLGYGSKADGGYNSPSQLKSAFPKVQHRNVYMSKKKKAELARQAADVEVGKHDPYQSHDHDGANPME